MTQSSSRGGWQGQSRRASSPKAYPPRPALVSNRIIIAQMMRASLHEEPGGLAGVLWTPFSFIPCELKFLLSLGTITPQYFTCFFTDQMKSWIRMYLVSENILHKCKLALLLLPALFLEKDGLCFPNN